MAEIIPIRPASTEYACPRCGSVWFTTAVQFSADRLRVVSWSESHAVCRECGLPCG